MTMQRGPTRTMDSNQRRKNDEHPERQGRREESFYVGESKENGTFSIASAEASPLHGVFYLSRRNADEGVLGTPFCRGPNAALESNRKPNGKECSISRLWTIRNPTQ